MYLDIKKLVDKNFPNKNQFAKSIGIGYPAACKLYDGDVSKINFDTLENICIALKCTPNDILKSELLDCNNITNTRTHYDSEENVSMNQLMQMIDSRITKILNNKNNTH